MKKIVMIDSTNIQRVLEGCLLGDGHLELHKHCKNARFSYLSSSKQHVEYVHQFFKHYCSDNYQEVKRSEYFDKRTDKTYVRYYFKTKALPIFTEQHQRFYSNGIKLVPKDLILDKTTLLFWYIGDGELESRYGFIKLHTNNFTRDDVNFLCSLLVNFNAKEIRKNDNQYLISIPRKKVKSFLSFIGPVIFSDYKHKWEFVNYKNKNIEVNGINSYSLLYPLVVEDFNTGKFTIYQLQKKYNIPIKAIKNHFNVNNIEWSPKDNRKEIIQCDLNGKELKHWESGQAVTKKLNYNASAISECCRGIRKKYKNFIWKFKK
jgi:hypothetical protein